MSGPQFTRPQSTELSDLGTMLESYHKLQPKPKIVPEFKEALQLIWSALPEKAIDNAVKGYCKLPQPCVSANDRYFEHYNVIIHTPETITVMFN